MTHPQQQEAAWQLMDRIYKRVVEATPGQPWPTTAFYDFGVPILEAALSTGAVPQPTRHRCSGCGHLWDARTTTAELCGDCWRRVQHVLHAGSVGADLDTARTLARTHRMPRDPFAEQLSEAILSLASEVETLRLAACPQHGDPLVCLACEAEEDQHPAWKAAQTETFRDWLARQLEVCRARAVNDNTKKSREYHGHTSILLHGILAEYDRRATGEGAVYSREEFERDRFGETGDRLRERIDAAPVAVSLDPHRPPETPLSRALRRMAKGTRLSSLDVPVLEDAADELDELTARLRGEATVRVEEDRLSIGPCSPLRCWSSWPTRSARHRACIGTVHTLRMRSPE
jgi:hypothetical protein